MFDINAIVNAAISAAVQQAIAPLVERIDTLEKNEEYLVKRIAVLENNPAQGVEPAVTIDEAKMVEALNSQEWFWDKLRNFIDAGIESAIDTHCETYDHDDYDRHIEDDDRHFEGDIDEAVREAVRNLSFDISVS